MVKIVSKNPYTVKKKQISKKCHISVTNKDIEKIPTVLNFLGQKLYSLLMGFNLIFFKYVLVHTVHGYSLILWTDDKYEIISIFYVSHTLPLSNYL